MAYGYNPSGPDLRGPAIRPDYLSPSETQRPGPFPPRMEPRDGRPPAGYRPDFPVSPAGHHYDYPMAPVTAPLMPPVMRPPRRGPGRILYALTMLLLLVVGLETAVLVALERRVTTARQSIASANASDRSRLLDLESRAGDLERRVMDPQAVAKDVLLSVFLVEAGRSLGTAFALGRDDGQGTNLVTNYHVVKDAYTRGDRDAALLRADQRFTARIVRVDPVADLALLRADERFPRLGPATTQAEPGQPVVVVGAPLGLERTVTAGIVSAVREETPRGPLLQFDAAASPGNSGGPVVNSRREVVGVTVSGISSVGAQSINFAIPIPVVCSSLAIC